MLFQNRHEAAQRLAERLDHFRGRNPLVLGIPRGAVPMARVIADALDGELDVVLVRKLGAPMQSELAIGSVSETGDVHLSYLVERFGIEQDYVDGEVERNLEILRKRRTLYTPVREPVDPANRITIVVDNGVATGWTMLAALRAIRPRNPEMLVAAMAVAPRSTIDKVGSEADETVCLATPDEFYAVGQFFRDFRQVDDEEVVECLRRTRSPDA